MSRTATPLALLLAACAGAAGDDLPGAQPAAQPSAQPAAQQPGAQPAAAVLPNVIVVLADDLGMGDLGCYEPDSKIPTPHMDRIAREGLRFTDAHSPSAVCTPTRYGVLTGRYCWRTRLTHGVLWGESASLIDLERLTLPEMLSQRGYRTACVGKWHLGLGSAEPTDYGARLHPAPVHHGFDESLVIPASLDMTPYVWVRDDRVEALPTERIGGSSHRRVDGEGFWRAGPIAPGFRHRDVLGRIGDEALAFLERARAESPERPFFLYLPLSAPHTPWLPEPEVRGRSGAGHYGDFVCQVDDLLGGLLAALDRLELAGDTLLVVTSDNGSHWPDEDVRRFGHDANLGYRGQKADIWEGGHRVPFLVRWPGVAPAGGVRDELLCLTDLFATLAAVVGVELPAGSAEDSVDQSAVLRGEELERAPRRDVVHHSIDGMFAIRKGSWKLCLGLGSGGFTRPARVQPAPGEAPGQLYDLAVDPRETTNRYLERPEVVAELLALLEQQARSGRSRPAD